MEVGSWNGEENFLGSVQASSPLLFGLLIQISFAFAYAKFSFLKLKSLPSLSEFVQNVDLQ